MEQLLKRMQDLINLSIEEKEFNEDRNWYYQRGVLLSYRDAKLILDALNQANKNLQLPDVSGRSEQLISFLEWRDKQNILTLHDYTNEELVRCYLKEINCH